MERVSHRWQPLQDYATDPVGYAEPDLAHLGEIWSEQMQLLSDADAIQKFNIRLRREWAIETGLLERIYTFDRGVTQMLIEEGIDAALIPHQATGPDPERTAAMIRDHETVIDGLFAFIKGDRELSVGYIKELHAALTQNQPTYTVVDATNRTSERELRRGAFKLHPNSPSRPDGSVHEYCPPEHVASEMDRLVTLHRAHDGVPPEVEAAWLHHRFTQIHPFEDGNGRVARCLATLVLIKARWFPLTVRDIPQEKKAYIEALEAADSGNLRPLVLVFSASQRRAFVGALGLSGQVLRVNRAEQVIAATRQKLEQRERETRIEWDKARQVAEALQQTTVLRFSEIAQTLKTQTSSVLAASNFSHDTEADGGPRRHYFRHQIIETAKRVGYFANTSDFHAWTRLKLRSESQSEILVSFHAIGHEFRGVLAVSACYFRREATEKGESEVVGVTPLSTEVFQINYRETAEDARGRYEPWLEDILVHGLELWRQTL